MHSRGRAGAGLGSGMPPKAGSPHRLGPWRLLRDHSEDNEGKTAR